MSPFSLVTVLTGLAIGVGVFAFPRVALEVQAQVQSRFKWKLELGSIERETTRMRFAGLIMIVGAVLGLVALSNFSDFLTKMIAVSTYLR